MVQKLIANRVQTGTLWTSLIYIYIYTYIYIYRFTAYPIYIYIYTYIWDTQLVDILRYKPEDRGFDSRWCHWNFSLTYSCRPHYGPGVDSASNINEYQEYFLGGKGGRCVRLTNLPPSCADCLEIWEPQTSETLRACPGL